MLREHAERVGKLDAEGDQLPVPLKPRELLPGRRRAMWLRAYRGRRNLEQWPNLLLCQLKHGLMLLVKYVGLHEGRRKGVEDQLPRRP